MTVPEGKDNWLISIYKGIGGVIKQADTTTKLIGLILLASLSFLTVVAINETVGATRILVIVSIVIITLSSLIIAGSLEKLRIVQGSLVKKTSISIFGDNKKKKRDAFISAPMDSSLDQDQKVTGRSQIMRIKRELEDICRMQNIFYAGSEITSEEEFDPTATALSENFEKLIDSKGHIFFYPERKPASTLVEVGMALALGLPSVWFVKEGVRLPFLLRQAWQNSNRSSELPKIIVHRYNDMSDISSFISDRKENFFG